VLPQRPSLAGNGRGCGESAGRGFAGLRRGRARARTHAYRRRDRGTGCGVIREAWGRSFPLLCFSFLHECQSSKFAWTATGRHFLVAADWPPHYSEAVADPLLTPAAARLLASFSAFPTRRCP